MKSEKEKEKLTGTVKRTVFRNESTGYGIATIDSQNVQHTIIGVMPNLKHGSPIEVVGAVENSPKYGLQFQISDLNWRAQSRDVLIKFFTYSLDVKLTEEKAAMIADKFGNEIFSIALTKNAGEEIRKIIPELSAEQADAAMYELAKPILEWKVFTEIREFHGGWYQAANVVQRYKRKALETLRATPYVVGQACGMDFKLSDLLAKKYGKDACSVERINRALNDAFEREKTKGNVFSTERELCQTARVILKRESAFEEEVPLSTLVKTLASSEDFIIEYDDEGYEAIFKNELWNAETAIVKQFQRLRKFSVKLPFDDSIIDKIEQECGIKYADAQREAFSLITRSGIAIVTGGPGTGKTTTVKGLITAYEKLNPGNVISLCAPTGRAAQRMAESTGRAAVTIHRLLNYHYDDIGNPVHRGENDRLDADLLIVDEASMLDVELAEALLTAVKSGALVLFIGDVNQLPSVGPGDVLHDFIRSGMINTVQLTTVYRQAGESPIITNANRINNGDTTPKTSDDYKIYQAASDDDVKAMTCRLAWQLYNKQKPFETQVLIPAHKGVAGVESINSTLQQMLNPPRGQKEIKYGENVFRVGDKIIMLNNNYTTGYFNGDIGVIADILPAGVVIDLCGTKLTISRSELADVSLAYAMTIHKSQGSEFPNVIIAMTQGSAMLKRNLLYTAVTRAKKTVAIITEGNAMKTAIESCDAGKRATRLFSRLKNCDNIVS